MSEISRPVIWLHKTERLPDTCISCGMFTDHRVNIKSAQQHRQSVASGGIKSELNADVALGCLLHLLGPIGWILAAILHSDKADRSGEKTVTLKDKIKVPCCRLCAGQQIPDPVQVNIPAGRYLFEVHSTFDDRLNSIRLESE